MEEELLNFKQSLELKIMKERWKKRMDELDFLLSIGAFIPLYQEEFEERTFLEGTILFNLHTLQQDELEAYLLLFPSSATEEDTVSLTSDDYYYKEKEKEFLLSRTHGG